MANHLVDGHATSSPLTVLTQAAQSRSFAALTLILASIQFARAFYVRLATSDIGAKIGRLGAIMTIRTLVEIVIIVVVVYLAARMFMKRGQATR